MQSSATHTSAQQIIEFEGADGAAFAEQCELSIVMPCLNETETVGTCVGKAVKWLESNRVQGEVIVVDNGRTDGSQQIARSSGARVVAVVRRGYGSTLMGGIGAARGKFIIMDDAADSYDFSDLGESVGQQAPST